MSDRERFSIAGRLRSLGFALGGIRLALASQQNMWIHTLATLLVCALGWLFRVSSIEWCLLAIAIASVFAAELLNTAFEALCDVVSPDYHPKVERAKDVSAGAVLVMASGAALTGAIIFGPRIVGLLVAR